MFTQLGTLIGGAFGMPMVGAAVGGLLDSQRDKNASDRAGGANADLQREFAQHGIRWRVADARAAGLHPLAALGATGASASPAFQAFSSRDGQDISGAMERTLARSEQLSFEAERAAERRRAEEAAARAEAREEKRLASQLLNDEVQRQYWASETARRAQARAPGAPESTSSVVPVPASGAVKVVPSEITSREKDRPHRVAGVEPAFLRVEVAPGVFVDVPNPKLNLDSELVHAAIAAAMYGNKWRYEYGNWTRSDAREAFRRSELESQKSGWNRWSDAWRPPRRGTMPRRDPYHGLW